MRKHSLRRHYKEQLKKYMGKGQLQCVPGEILLISLFNHKRHEGYKNEGPPPRSYYFIHKFFDDMADLFSYKMTLFSL